MNVLLLIPFFGRVSPCSCARVCVRVYVLVCVCVLCVDWQVWTVLTFQSLDKLAETEDIRHT